MPVLFGEPRQYGSPARAPESGGAGFYGRARDVASASRRIDNIGGIEILRKEAYAELINDIYAETGERLPHPITDTYEESAEEVRRAVTAARLSGLHGGEVIGEQTRRIQEAAFRRRVAALREKYPEAKFLREDNAIEMRMSRRAQALEGRAGEAGFGAQLVGGFAASLTDPVTIATLPIGVSSKTVLQAALREGAVNAGLEAVLQPAVQDQRRELGLEAGAGQAALNVVTAFGAGAVLGGAGKGVERALGFAPKVELPSRRKAIIAGKKSADPELRAGAAELERELEIEADVEAAAGGPLDAGAKAAASQRIEAAARVVDAVTGGETPDPADVRTASGVGEPVRAAIIREDVAVTPRGGEVGVRYAIVDLDDIVASHDLSFARNPRYPAELQPRDRARAASAAQVTQLAASLNPRLLDQAASSAEGAPVIRPDGVVLSGNGRALALMRAYENDLSGARAYREYLEGKGYPVDGAARPVLVRIADDLTDAEGFARDSNARTTAAMSAAEQARADAKAIAPGDLDLLDGDNPAAVKNAAFIRRVVERIAPEAERGALMDRHGRLSDDGLRRVRNAIFAFAYDDAALIDRLLDGGDELKSLGEALLDAAPEWARLKGDIDSGAVDPRVDVRPFLAEAANIVAEARRAGRNVAEFVGQQDMFTGVTDARTVAFLRLFFRKEDFTGARARPKIAEELSFYAAEARKVSNEPALFGGDDPDPAGRILAAAAGRADGGGANAPGLFDTGADGRAPSLLPDAEGGSGGTAPARAADLDAEPLQGFDEPHGQAAADQADGLLDGLADEADDALVTGALEIDPDTNEPRARTQSRADLEAEFAQDKAIIDRLKGCVKP